MGILSNKCLDIYTSKCYLKGMDAKQKLQELRNNGIKISELARTIGTSESQIVRWCKTDQKMNASSQMMVNLKLRKAKL
jgi:DNA-binding transcriptional regulator YiaG